MKYAHMIAFILLIVGGVAWGIYGLLGTDLIYSILGESLSRIVYILVGVAAVYEVVTHKGRCKECAGQM
ncbi:hypothetical protein A2853_02735 [Candidatus Kaiserbacteria bacterium RIFCSPHIGHO2_01_FULL_55_17]|uniref:DUF378 domain-containing protein n=1 Tax=Candidatus Kaiserbacteria bacterium RIFCSPHIGHO2_01_FULL_55_17 TaxID=1798484 RepID=A0A1F6D857_9BACT|nr:MAG: hypothetical protein A2853_02735 [Candidatus Kaiserbacteria bacterium RIFCSPHIGHO2_01_FULL_55_17]